MRGAARNGLVSIAVGHVQGLLAEWGQLLHVGGTHEDGHHVKEVLDDVLRGRGPERGL